MRTKARLTVSFNKDSLSLVDELIDKKLFANRSQAIESLVRQALKPKIDKAVILAGKTLRDGVYPPLLRIDDQALINIILAHLEKYGIREVIVLAGRQDKKIRKTIEPKLKQRLKLRWLKQKKLWGTAGALKLAEPYLGKGSFLVMHGDLLTDLNLDDFIKFHQVENSLATIAVKPRSSEKKYGKVLMQGNRITEYLGSKQIAGISIVNTGIYLIRTEVLGLIKKNKASNLETDVLPKLAEQRELSAFLFQGVWFDVSDKNNLQQAQLRWRMKGR